MTDALFIEAAAEARAQSRRYWAKGGNADRKYPVQKLPRFWPLPKPRNPDPFLNPHSVRVLYAIHELLMNRDFDAIESLIAREIEKVEVKADGA